MTNTNDRADDFSDLTPNQKRALSKGLSALETMAALWASEIRLSEMAKRIADVNDPVERAKRVQAMLELAFTEGAYRHYLDHKDKCDRAAISSAVPDGGKGEAVYQVRMRLTGDWRDQDESSYLYNMRTAPGDTRVLFTAPQAECAPRADLHPATVDLVRRFSEALANKLAGAEKKYGYSDAWQSPDWMDECRAQLMRHIEKGDPRDVAAYCAFLWHHGESTAARAIEQAVNKGAKL